MKKIVALVLSLVMVLGLATTAFGAVEATLYDLDAEGAWKVMGSAGADLDTLYKDYDDGVLPSYKVGADYFVETTEAAATYKLVYGAKTVFLAPATLAKISFVAKASALTVVGADDAVCGAYVDTAFDEDNTYYASYTKKGLLDKVFVASKTGAVNVLVDGKLVAADEVATVAQAAHNWVGFDVVNYEYTTVKCTECGKVAALYANATAAGKNCFQTAYGFITAAANGFTAAGAATSTDKVESAQTFDAGIAMYVGMSVMAAAGSAVVLKKKD